MGVYLHVPFCLRKCPYCSFFSVAGSDAQYTGYAGAVTNHADRIRKSGWTGGREAATIFVGGGTPSILKPELLAELLTYIRHCFPETGTEIEISLEVNPATILYTDLVRLQRAGFNRISIGVQSLSDRELNDIGRPHTAADALQAFSDARRAGFSNINIDLMYGLPGQKVESWEKTLQKALEYAPDHLAIYELTIEEGTLFALREKEGSLHLPVEDEVLKMMALTAETLSGAGFKRYEISNYARPGMECRHNINYWKNGWYVGLGPGAVSCLSGRRYSAAADVDEYCRTIASGEDWWSDMEELDREARFRETVIMGLRMTSGVSLTDLIRRFGLNALDYYGGTLEQLEQQKLVELQGDRLRLSLSGMDLANQVMAKLV